MVVTRDRGQGWQVGLGELVLNGCRVSVWDDEKVPEMNGGDGCTIMWKYLMSLKCIFKMG